MSAKGKEGIVGFKTKKPVWQCNAGSIIIALG
jgi:hypothetical protein